MIYLGIDPGKRGAAVAIDCAGSVVLSILTESCVEQREYMPHAMRRALEPLAGDQVTVAIERQWSRPTDTPLTAFAIGYGYGLWRALVAFCGWTQLQVPPKTWQASVTAGAPGRGKERAIWTCQRILPTLDLTPGRRRVPHDGLADAGCLALYCRSHAADLGQ